MDIDEIQRDHRQIWALTEPVLKAWPEHEPFLAQSFAAHDPATMPALTRLADDILVLSDGRLDELVEGYRWMCDAFLEEEIYFRRNRRYRCESLEQAVREVYSDRQVMTWYMDGLLISQLLWSNHARAFLHYAGEFLRLLPTGYDLLEIGCGHGLLISTAARDANSGALCGWDISAQSIEHTRKALTRFGLEGGVELKQHDLFAADGNMEFDAIVVSEILEHVEDPGLALRRLSRQLRPGGRIFVNFPINSPAPDHIYLLQTPDAVATLVEENGYEIVDQRAFPMTGYTLERANATQVTVTCTVIGRKPRP